MIARAVTRQEGRVWPAVVGADATLAVVATYFGAHGSMLGVLVPAIAGGVLSAAAIWVHSPVGIIKAHGTERRRDMQAAARLGRQLTTRESERARSLLAASTLTNDATADENQIKD